MKKYIIISAVSIAVISVFVLLFFDFGNPKKPQSGSGEEKKEIEQKAQSRAKVKLPDQCNEAFFAKYFND